VPSLTLHEVKVGRIRKLFGGDSVPEPVVPLSRGDDARAELQVVRFDSITESPDVLNDNQWLIEPLAKAEIDGGKLMLVETGATLSGGRRRFLAGRLAAVIFHREHNVSVHLPLTPGPVGREKIETYEEMLLPPETMKLEDAAVIAASQAVYQLTR
jgi:hypothetical protein